jgi:formamidopyrimidine-DNA glycosylase
MPEGPEIKYIKELCKKFLIGKTLEKIVSNSDTKVKLPKKSKVIDVEVKGKQLVLIFEDFWFLIHFGLTGWLTFEDAKYPRYELHFNDDLIAYIDDSRRFSKLKIYETEEKYEKAMEKLGVDIFSEEFTEEFFLNCFGKKKKVIVAFLMDQSQFCGIGNYIKNESLYLARISPKRKTNDLTDEEKSKLYKSILYVAYSNFVENMNINKIKVDKNDKHRIKELKIKVKTPYKFNVYGRDDSDLKGNKLTIEDIGGRTCYYVKSLQI